MAKIEDDFEQRPIRSTLKWGSILIGCVGVLYAVTVGAKLVLAPVAIASKTFDPENIVQNYEWFKRQYNDYLAMDPKIATAQAAFDQFKLEAGDRSKWTFEDKQNGNHLSMVLVGLKSQKFQIAAEYNARASMMNRAVFRGELPEHLE